MGERDSDRNRSDIEPVDVIFQRIAQKQQLVPQSLERGASHQAVHDPVPPSARSPDHVAPSVVLAVTTTAEPRRRATRTAFAVALLAALAIGGVLMQLVSR